MMYSMEFYSHLYINYLMFIYTKFLELIFNLLLLTILSPKRDIFLLCQIIYVFEVFVSNNMTSVSVWGLSLICLLVN